jgi:hypothetical protein
VASLQKRNGSYRILFCHYGKLHTFPIGKVERDEAENKARQVEYLLMRLKQRLIVLHAGTEIVTFVEHDGKPPDSRPTLPNSPRQAVTIGHLKDRYLTTYANSTIEASSLDTCKLHLGHFTRTMAEIKRQIAAGGDADTLWEALYLEVGELAELLTHIKMKVPQPWVYPLFCFAAHTGARRSESLRALVADVDFAGNTVLIRVKKRSREERTTRRVPLTSFLKKSSAIG